MSSEIWEVLMKVIAKQSKNITTWDFAPFWDEEYTVQLNYHLVWYSECYKCALLALRCTHSHLE